MASMIRQVWLLLVLGIVFGISLAYTDKLTRKRIEDNRLAQIRQLAQKIITGLPVKRGELGSDRDSGSVYTVELNERTDLKEKGLWAFEVRDTDKKTLLGYVVIGEGIGWDRLKVLIGLDVKLDNILGIDILDLRETPGLGARISEDWFKKQFIKPTDRPLELVKGKAEGRYQIQAITGATISSTAVVDIVNKTVNMAKKLLSK